LLPASGCLVQHHLGAANAGAFDLNAACTGFLSGLIAGAQFIRSGTYQRVLVVAGETLSRFTNWKDRGTCVLFGDGAAAVVLEATEQDCGVLSTMMGCQGDLDGLLTIEAGGSAKPASAETVAQGGHLIGMRGNELFKIAVRSMTQAAKQVLAEVNLTCRDLRKVIPHQANLRIITSMQQALGLTDEQVFVTLDRYGNTGAASVPMALAQYAETERVEPGDHLLLVAFGGGLTWAAAVIRWGDVNAIREARNPHPEIRPAPRPD
jgi:3-oxoacyl-[acyl-carrier-protein] synthase-3